MALKYPNDPAYTLLETIADADIITIHKSVPVDPQNAPEGFTTHHTTGGILKAHFQNMQAKYTASKYVVPDPGGYIPGDGIAVNIETDTAFTTSRLAIVTLSTDDVYTITLPAVANLRAGDKIIIINNGVDYLTNPAVLNNNGARVNGVLDVVTLNEDKVCIEMEVLDTDLGWSITKVWSHTPILV